MESGVECIYQAWREQSVNVGGYALQAAPVSDLSGTGFGASVASAGARRGSASGLNTTEMREWAKTQGIEVKDRGRVPAELVVKFKAATGQ
jgi:hypothetical protein